MAKPTLAIIDGKSVFYRGYFALPNLSTGEGQPTSGVYGFAVMAVKVLKELKPDYVVVAWDKSKTNIRARRQLYPAYKAGRKPMPEELRAQIPILRELLEAFRWPLYEIDDFEADDIMATFAKQARAKGLKTVLVTSDLDVLQAVDGDVEVVAIKRGLTQTVRYSREKFRQEYGLTPEQFIDYKALRGDASDNVPGVAGIGDKTAKNLVQKFGSLRGVYANLDKVPPSLRTKLEQGKDMAFLSHRLLEVRFDVPMKLDLGVADAKRADPAAITKLFDQLQFRRLLTELPEYMTSQSSLQLPAKTALPKFRVTELTAKSDLKTLKIGSKTVLYTLSEIDPLTKLPKISEAIISPSAKQIFLIRNPDLTEAILPLLKSTTLIGHHLKVDLKAWQFFSPKALFDVMLAAFILNPLLPQPMLSELARKDLDINLDEALLIAPLGDAGTAGQIATSLWQLHDYYQKALTKQPSLKKVLETLEFPLVPVLAEMENFGVKLDTIYLAQMAKDLTRRIEKVRELIFDEAKADFNISSPQQLQQVLFERLQLPKTDIKRTKQGYSTAASELEKLRGLHPIINLISEYRELTKLKSTYVDALPQSVDQNGRLHTSFNQAVAQTGRLSSDKPNLQNIPIRTEVGRAIRRAFVADAGYVLVSADYSQFELRLAAVLADDKNMIHAFNKGIDIHAMTAAEIYDLDDIEMVTKDQRYSAKTVNFGVLYGMSPHGLSLATGMSHDQAKTFIDKYFGLRQKLLEYLESLKDKSRRDGYVETLFGRRRPTPDVHSPNFAVRQAAERAAINMPIQGSAADLMKLAMIKIDQELDEGCQMLLQIHDSILVECPKAQANQVADLLKRLMESVHPLPVKLEVDVKISANWGEL